MTAPESPASLLRRAAARIDQLAAETSGDSWNAVENYPDAWVVRAHYAQKPPGSAEYLAAESSHGDMKPADVRWMVALGPQVAPHLSSWLRFEADQFERDGWDSAEDDWAPLALARALLAKVSE